MDEDRKLNALLSMLQFRMETDTEENNAEKFSAYSLQTLGTDEGGAAKSESVLLYGVEPDSRYVQLPGDGVYLSSGYADKYELGAGDTITCGKSTKIRPIPLRWTACMITWVRWPSLCPGKS